MLWWPIFSLKGCTCLFYIINTMADDALSRQGAGASPAIILTTFFQNIPASVWFSHKNDPKYIHWVLSHWIPGNNHNADLSLPGNNHNANLSLPGNMLTYHYKPNTATWLVRFSQDWHVFLPENIFRLLSLIMVLYWSRVGHINTWRMRQNGSHFTCFIDILNCI